LDAPVVASSAVAATNPAVQVSIQGLNHRDQRPANGGSQFSVEPPDQALCIGNGFTVEAVNSVLRVYSSSAAPLTVVQDLNTFFGYPAAIDRTTGVVGADVIDPVCHDDPVFRRFVVAITTLDVTPAGDSGRHRSRILFPGLPPHRRSGQVRSYSLGLGAPVADLVLSGS